MLFEIFWICQTSTRNAQSTLKKWDAKKYVLIIIWGKHFTVLIAGNMFATNAMWLEIILILMTQNRKEDMLSVRLYKSVRWHMRYWTYSTFSSVSSPKIFKPFRSLLLRTGNLKSGLHFFSSLIKFSRSLRQSETTKCHTFEPSSLQWIFPSSQRTLITWTLHTPTWNSTTNTCRQHSATPISALSLPGSSTTRCSSSRWRSSVIRPRHTLTLWSRKARASVDLRVI